MSANMLSAATLAAALVVVRVHADVYMHNPRGSNDRNCERNVNRNNGNRLFDSQNNAKGGYACPRAVGPAEMQDEDGVAGFGGFDQDKKMYFYEGSVLPIEWTNQHGCGTNSKVNCEIILQYMCEDTADPSIDDFWPYTDGKSGAASVGKQHFRDGAYIASPRDGIPTDADDAATDTIPDTEDAAIPDTAADRRFGMHESYDQYDLCQHTERNGGLYTADQRMRRTDQRGTRQNPNGDRRGLECPEERDHYPWWHPSPWIDIAVLSNEGGDTPCTDPEECETARCKYYLENSFNRNQKGYCDVEHGQGVDASAKTSTAEWTGNRWHNNRAACEAAGFVWYMKSLDDVLTGLPYPTCAKTQFSRVNHLGNSADATVDATTGGSDDAPHGVNANRYLWTIPSIPAGRGGNVFEGNDGGGMQSAYASCTLRMRYNISSSDFPQWPIDAQEVAHDWLQEMVDSANNSVTDYSPNTPLIQDPYIFIGPGDDAESTDRFLSLAVNTNQYGRTFQDRSYKFAVRRRPTTAAASNDQTDTPKVPTTETDDKIYNINVRGKRGNIVQTFPAVEYDFVPNSLAVDVGDFVHFQWTGSDYNPRRGCNDAEGGPPDPNDFVGTSSSNSRADRSNLVFMNTMAENVPKDMEGTPTGGSDATFAAKAAAQKTASLEDVPCADSDACHDTIVRLAYLNQQSDGGALQLRRGAGCLSTEELDDISNKNERENHSRNCAKLNAKPYPYFDGGLVKMARPGKYAYFSSRNNNLSNRDQTGIICVRGTDSNGEVFTCDVDGDTGALEDENRAVSTAEVRDISQTAMAASRCNEEASSNAAANNQGASSCILQAKAGLSDILTSESFTIEQQDNDAMGSGNALACTELRFTYPSGQTKFINGVGLAIGLLFVGLCSAWACVFSYNRLKAYRTAGMKFTDTESWKRDKGRDEFL